MPTQNDFDEMVQAARKRLEPSKFNEQVQQAVPHGAKLGLLLHEGELLSAIGQGIKGMAQGVYDEFANSAETIHRMRMQVQGKDDSPMQVQPSDVTSLMANIMMGGGGRGSVRTGISNEVLGNMNRTLKAKGYDVRGVGDLEDLITKRPKSFQRNRFRNPDWQDAYEKAIGSRKARVSKAKTKAEFKNIDRGRLRELGYTSDVREAGYIAHDGRMRDLSGKAEGGMPGTRSLDHREAGGYSGMQEMMASGEIRIDAQSGMFQLGSKPTLKQKTALKKAMQETDGWDMELKDGLGEYDAINDAYSAPHQRVYRSYPQGTNFQRVINDINAFYEGKDLLPILGQQ